MSKLRARLLTISAMVSVLALAAVPAFAQTMPTGSDGVTTLGQVFQDSVGDFTTLLMDLAPYLFGGLVTVLLIRLAIKWFQRVTRSV